MEVDTAIAMGRAWMAKGGNVFFPRKTLPPNFIFSGPKMLRLAASPRLESSVRSSGSRQNRRRNPEQVQKGPLVGVQSKTQDNPQARRVFIDLFISLRPLRLREMLTHFPKEPVAAPFREPPS
jgi:hypothetical protein